MEGKVALAPRSQRGRGRRGGCSTPAALVVAQRHSNLASLETGKGAKIVCVWVPFLFNNLFEAGEFLNVARNLYRDGWIPSSRDVNFQIHVYRDSYYSHLYSASILFVC